MKKIKATNPELIAIVRDLKKKSQQTKSELWQKIAKHLASPKRSRVAVNVSRINRFTKNEEIIVIPGKVLGAGKVSHPLTVAAFNFSDLAQSKINYANGKCLSLRDLMKKNPTGENVRLMV